MLKNIFLGWKQCDQIGQNIAIWLFFTWALFKISHLLAVSKHGLLCLFQNQDFKVNLGNLAADLATFQTIGQIYFQSSGHSGWNQHL